MRYVVFGDVSYSHIPVFLLNKSLAFSSVICLFLTAVGLVRSQSALTRFWGKASLHTALLHTFFSIFILTPSYFPLFFKSGKLNLLGETMILFGASAAYLYYLVQRKYSARKPVKVLEVLLVIFISGHLLTRGAIGWFAVGNWPGHLPPISMISFLLVALAFVVFLRTVGNAPE